MMQPNPLKAKKQIKRKSNFSFNDKKEGSRFDLVPFFMDFGFLNSGDCELIILSI